MYFAKSYKKKSTLYNSETDSASVASQKVSFRSQKDYSCNASVVHLQAIVG